MQQNRNPLDGFCRSEEGTDELVKTTTRRRRKRTGPEPVNDNGTLYGIN